MTVNAADGLTAIAAGGRGDASRRMSSGSGAGVGGWLCGWVAHRAVVRVAGVPGPVSYPSSKKHRTEASKRVPRMFKSHAWQQYDKQMKCYE
jgi:hypothetical protein